MKTLLFGLMMLTMGVLPASANDAPIKISNDGAKIIVVGKGLVEVMPDMGHVHMTVTTRAKTAKEAQEANARTVKAVVDGLVEKFNFDREKDIRTTGYSVSPEYQEVDGEPRQLVGYVARHSLSVRVLDIDLLGPVVDHAGSLGAGVDYIQFGLQNQTTYEHQALKAAMAHAEGRARALAEANGRALGRVLKVSEVSYAVENPRENMEEDQSSDGSTEIFPDAVSISATLTVEYEF